MAAYTTSLTITEIAPNAGLKEIIVLTPLGVTASDTLVIPLTDYGISASGLYSISAVTHSGNFCIIGNESFTCVTSTTGQLTITSTTGGTLLSGMGRKCYRILGTSAR